MNCQDIEVDDYWTVYNCLCRAITEIIDTHESMRPRDSYHGILNQAELSLSALLDQMRGDNEEEEEE